MCDGTRWEDLTVETKNDGLHHCLIGVNQNGLLLEHVLS